MCHLETLYPVPLRASNDVKLFPREYKQEQTRTNIGIIVRLAGDVIGSMRSCQLVYYFWCLGWVGPGKPAVLSALHQNSSRPLPLAHRIGDFCECPLAGFIWVRITLWGTVFFGKSSRALWHMRWGFEFCVSLNGKYLLQNRFYGLNIECKLQIKNVGDAMIVLGSMSPTPTWVENVSEGTLTTAVSCAMCNVAKSLTKPSTDMFLCVGHMTPRVWHEMHITAIVGWDCAVD